MPETAKTLSESEFCREGDLDGLKVARNRPEIRGNSLKLVLGEVTNQKRANPCKFNPLRARVEEMTTREE